MKSVSVATYTGGKYILKQIDSILKQLSAFDEIIVSKDGSKDDTLDIITAFHDNRIKVFYNNGRHGVVPNFENVLSYAKENIIFLSGQDDIWTDDKVQIVVDEQQNTDLELHDAHIMDKRHCLKRKLLFLA